ncbi:MAG TPA: CGNR zinc finger domain-containing protein [Tahibacter sp.]|uniref:CGNR zinc finger domain-containing protein n=1 Tax=Tahibacter sp. TaxID=2056211 RepID=UPI002C767324|nr:CGNR zinc finger domain-containing protein [Tahibacter sp.]HSX59254.1 CGNR zinc finger domain-containing protein [Tahibacter sp.]
MRTETHVFTAADLVGGDLALDLVNTATARDSVPRDWVPDYAALLRWARTSGVFAARDLATLDRLAAASPHKARAALVRIKAFRESLCTALYALVRGREPAAADLDRLQTAYAAAAAAAQLRRRDGRLVRRWTVAGSQLDLVLHVAAMRALALLEQVELSRLRVCDGHDCGWVFVDTSKSGRRRWCDMATCGNTAKAQRFQRRQAAA